MANNGDFFPTSPMPRVAAARESIEEENPAVPSPPRSESPTSSPPPTPRFTANLPPRPFTAPGRTNRPPPGFTANLPPRPFTAPAGRANRTQDNESLINSLRSPALTRPGPATETCLQSLFNLMTTSKEEGAAQFRELISALDENDFQSMATLLTLNHDCYFLMIARNRNGSNRLQMLLEESEDTHTIFLDAILRRFFHIMTDKNASHVAIKGLRVFSEEKKAEMHDHILRRAINLARDQYGSLALRIIITNLGHSAYREQLLHIVTLNAFTLSCNAHGNFVVQHVLQLHDLDPSSYKDQLLRIIELNALTLSSDAHGNFVVRFVLELNNRHCTKNVAISLNGHCVELSFNKYGSYIVEKLLETEWWARVVTELLCCDVPRLMSLAGSEYGNFVVLKALTVAQGEVETNAAPFWDLVNKLTANLNLLGDSHGSNVAGFLDAVQYFITN